MRLQRLFEVAQVVGWRVQELIYKYRLRMKADTCHMRNK